MRVHYDVRRVLHPASRVALVACVCSFLAQSATAGSNDPVVVRVRSTDASLAVLIDRASTQSMTFQRLLATIQRSNGIVHVEAGTCGHGVRACLKIWMELVAQNRFLRVVIDRRKDDSDLDVMGTTGHELQHVIEALSESGTTDSIGLYNFFTRLAPNGGNRFETTAAIDAGDRIRVELGGR
jgi:hypothetical protein